VSAFLKTSEDSARANPGKKLLSICIPTFNRASYLPETLESICTQLSPDVELLVYDTGSTDGTQELMARLQRECPRIHFFSLDTRRGVDETLLLLLEQSSGEYVWFFGSDDILKARAIEIIRQRILESAERPALIYVNHEVVNNSGKLLIPSHIRSQKDRLFRDGRKCAAWLGLNLGYISSCIFRREAGGATAAKEFVGSLWLGLYLNLKSLSSRRPALYIGQPLVSARRNPANTYDYGKVFFRDASHVFWSTRRHGLGWFTVWLAMNKTVRTIYSRFSVAWRCDNRAEFRNTFPVMLGTCWKYPWFWLLIFPVRLVPPGILRIVRNRLRQWRDDRNESSRPSRSERRRGDIPHGVQKARGLGGAFGALVRTRKWIAASGGDRRFKAIPFLVTAYRGIYARLRPKETIEIEFRGHQLHLDLTDIVVARSLLTSGEWEQYETRIFAETLEQGMVVVDIGANIGHYTLEAARRVGKNGKVFAFEPEPHNFSLLCRNIAANHYQNVVPVRKALSNRNGTGRLTLSPDNLGGHHFENSGGHGEAVLVDVVTLDEFFSDGNRRIDVIKMDAEGAEMGILEGMRGIIESNPDLILFTEFFPGVIRAAGDDPEKFLRTLSDSGFQIGILDQACSRIEALPAGPLNGLVDSLLREEQGRLYVDLLCVRGKSVRMPFGPDGWSRAAGLAQAASAR
jgi:FkbM family methyltransferase